LYLYFFITKAKPTLTTILASGVPVQIKEASTLRYCYH